MEYFVAFSLFVIFITYCHAALRPNILFILTDDMGIGEVGVYPGISSKHGRIETPNIDKLAKSGMIFTDAYSGVSVCAPSRCSLLTGRHTGHTIIRGNYPYKGSDLPLRPEDTTFAQLLSSSGYKTGLFGKWGLGNYDSTGAPWLKGFQTYYGILDQAECHNMYPTKIWDNDTIVSIPENTLASRLLCMSQGNKCQWAHELFYNKLVDFITDNSGDKSKPWFGFLAFTDPHAGGYLGTLETGNPVPSDGKFSKESWPDVEKDHASVITNYEDEHVGNLMEMLDLLEIRNDTIIIFSSDNGAHNEGGHNYEFFNSSGIYRGFKRSLYEGGIRTPLIFNWPNKIKEGSVSNFPTAFWDIFPTLADLAGVDSTNLTDGVSILPTLLGEKQEKANEYLYWEFCTNNKWGHAVRSGKYKAVSLAKNQPFELYDLEDDPSETKNIAKDHPDIIEKMNQYSQLAHTDNPYFPIDNCVSS